MNIPNIIKQIEKVDPEVYERLDTRRSAMKSFAGIGSKIALAASTTCPGLFVYKSICRNNGYHDTVLTF